MIIADIIPVDKKRCKILPEHGEAFVLYNGEIRRFGIESGLELSDKVFCQIQEEVLKKRVKERALYLLKSMDRTENEVRTKLKKGYYAEELIDYAVDFLKQYGYIDDQRYAENYIRTYMGKKSRKIIQQSLYLKGISKETAEEAFELFEDKIKGEDERELIYTLLKKKKYHYENSDKKEKNRVMAFLMRKGFEMEDVMYCLRNQPEE